MHELLTTDEMGQADRSAVSRGDVPDSYTLMTNAAHAIAGHVERRFREALRIAVLCGPGNNGGDGYAAADLLDRGARHIEVFALGSPEQGTDAAQARSRWTGTIHDLQAFEPTGFELIIDALFGAGLSRPITGIAADAIRRLNGSSVPVLSVDLPSGINGDDGKVRGIAVEATETLTFFRKKPGHLLGKGRLFCGPVHVADIGISSAVLEDVGSHAIESVPATWLPQWPDHGPDTHKYARGAAAVCSGGPMSTGAARLAARAAARIGAGAVTVLSPPNAALVNASQLAAIMVRSIASAAALPAILAEAKTAAVLLGPGFGVGERMQNYVKAALDPSSEAEGLRGVVLDADALTSFQGQPGFLFDAIAESKTPVVLTPHQGEFARLFPDLSTDEFSGSKLDRARKAAARSGAFVVLKGSDTVVAAPDGRAGINPNGTALLATAGSGDTLAGMITGLLAQRMAPFAACCAAVWIHAEAARHFGPGLTADDLADAIPPVLRDLFMDA